MQIFSRVFKYFQEYSNIFQDYTNIFQDYLIRNQRIYLIFTDFRQFSNSRQQTRLSDTTDSPGLRNQYKCANFQARALYFDHVGGPNTQNTQDLRKNPTPENPNREKTRRQKNGEKNGEIEREREPGSGGLEVEPPGPVQPFRVPFVALL